MLRVPPLYMYNMEGKEGNSSLVRQRCYGVDHENSKELQESLASRSATNK
jgi:hypothetical protein